MESAKTVNIASRLEGWKESATREESGRRAEYQSKRMSAGNLAIVKRWADRWIRNAAVNFPLIRTGQGLDFLRGAAKGLPVVCVGIGPSLDRVLPKLRAFSRKALIIACDAAVAPLLASDICPDIVVNFDCRDEQETLWTRIKGCPASRGLVLLANSCASPKMLDAWPGKLMFFNMSQGDDEFVSNVLPTLFHQLGSLPNLGTVGNSAVILAHLMEAASIYLAGYDFCYAPPRDAERPAVNDAIPEERYRCSDYIWSDSTLDLPSGGFVEIENAILYDNDVRRKEIRMIEDRGHWYPTDDLLWSYRSIFLEAVGGLGISVTNVGSEGSLNGIVESISIEEFTERGFSLQDMRPGNSVIPHLYRLLDDPRRHFRLEDGLWAPRPAPSIAAVESC